MRSMSVCETREKNEKGFLQYPSRHLRAVWSGAPENDKAAGAAQTWERLVTNLKTVWSHFGVKNPVCVSHFVRGVCQCFMKLSHLDADWQAHANVLKNMPCPKGNECPSIKAGFPLSDGRKSKACPFDHSGAPLPLPKAKGGSKGGKGGKGKGKKGSGEKEAHAIEDFQDVHAAVELALRHTDHGGTARVGRSHTRTVGDSGTVELPICAPRL